MAEKKSSTELELGIFEKDEARLEAYKWLQGRKVIERLIALLGTFGTIISTIISVL